MRPYIAINTAHIAHVDVGIAQAFALSLAVACERIAIGIVNDKSKFIEADDSNDMSAVGKVATNYDRAIFDDFLFDLCPCASSAEVAAKTVSPI